MILLEANIHTLPRIDFTTSTPFSRLLLRSKSGFSLWYQVRVLSAKFAIRSPNRSPPTFVSPQAMGSISLSDDGHPHLPPVPPPWRAFSTMPDHLPSHLHCLNAVYIILNFLLYFNCLTSPAQDSQEPALGCRFQPLEPATVIFNLILVR